MISINETRSLIQSDPENWSVYLMDFVDEFRRSKNMELLDILFKNSDEKWDPLLAATVASLCDEMKLKIPDWILDIPACKDPWFVSGVENLKAIALVESPLQFRIRKIFVLENFLHRV
ncbi:MAG: hypothetical protein ACKVQC_05075 [Elusimicrobiota bacterium]